MTKLNTFAIPLNSHGFIFILIDMSKSFYGLPMTCFCCILKPNYGLFLILR